jgi:hypothetical protein
VVEVEVVFKLVLVLQMFQLKEEQAEQVVAVLVGLLHMLQILQEQQILVAEVVLQECMVQVEIMVVDLLVALV